MGYLDKAKALEAIQNQGGKVVNFDLIESTLGEIGKKYRSGLIRWIREEPGRWNRLLQMEGKINQAVLSKDEVMLKDVLSEYRDYFSGMVEVYGKSGTLPLFGGTE